jgi:crossover junction endodeoxyribonuclease RuvC
MNLWIGIDPGLTGAVAAIDDYGNLVALQDTPVITVRKGKGRRSEYSEPGMTTLLEGILNSGEKAHARVLIENVHSMPKQGVASSFSFGVGFGIWRGIIAALRLPCERVEPTVWKRALHLSRDKGKAVQRALRLYPRADLGHTYHGRTIYHDGRAEALLLAHYARFGVAENTPKSKSAVKSRR